MSQAVALAPTQSARTASAINRVWPRVLLFAVFLVLWTIMSWGLPTYIFPDPVTVGEVLVRLASNGTLFHHLLITFYRVVAGFLFAALIGVPLGIFLGASKRVGAFFEPVLPVISSVSSTCWAIIAVIWFGVSDATPIFVAFMTALPLVTTNVWQGTRNVSWEWLELAQSLQMSRLQTLRKIYLPAITPYFYSASRLALGFGWRVSLVAEALGAGSGVGYMILRAADLVQTSHVFAWTIAVVTTMLLLETLLIRPTEAWLFRWKRESE